MDGLSASRLRKVLRATAEVTEFAAMSEFRLGAIALARELVPCDSASYNELKPGATALVVADPSDWLTAESVGTFGRLAGENPLVAHYQRTGDGRPLRLSDFLSRRRLHELMLYHEIYRPMGIEHQVAFVLPSPPGEVVGIALNRQRRDFSGEELAMLELLRRPLRACYRRLFEREELVERLAAHEAAGDLAPRAEGLGLSRRQVEIVLAMIGGASNAELGMRLGISRRTVEKHLENIYTRLGVTSRTEATAKICGHDGPARAGRPPGGAGGAGLQRPGWLFRRGAGHGALPLSAVPGENGANGRHA